MARIESRVRDLVGSDADMRAAVETVLDRADDGEVEWADVRDELTSGQWGRLIEKGILVDGDEGFRLADVGETRAGLEDDTSGSGGSSSSSSTDVDTGDSSWSKYDKGAAVVTVGLFLGYSVSEVRNVIGGVMDVVLGPVAGMLPFYAVVMVLALATGLYSTLLQANLMDMEKMGKYQERMKNIQQRQKDAKERGDDAELEKIQEEQMEAMGDQMGMFKEQFRPMVWIMFLTIPVFLWMYWAIGVGGNAQPHIDAGTIVLPLVGTAEWTQGVLGPMQAWIVWYFLCSMGFTQIIRKSLNIDMSPSAS
ncbi:DUF106 domain-containing protein [Haloferax sp. KTX1]|uniref:DUF106 domain-containing protein n=1 Tax=Haloferax sp. KTX1 TaxID=2600597 RepID=UPI0011DD62BD|nr:DUF106 domain-containing protein [Haloferax sp. KTX1]